MVLSVLWFRILSSGPTDVILSAAAVVVVVAYAAGFGHSARNLRTVKMAASNNNTE